MNRSILYLYCCFIFLFLGCKKNNNGKDNLGEDNAYFVATNGSDKNTGTHDAPFKTIQKAVDLSEPGNIVYIMAGTYTEKITIKNSGTENNYITIRAYPDNNVVIDGTNVSLQIPSQALIRLENAHYIKLEGLTIINSQSCGIYGKDGSSNVIIEKCSVSNCVAPGICFGADFIGTKNIMVRNNYVENCAQLSREAISLRTVDNFEIAYNIVKNVIKESIDVKSGCKNGTIHHNEIINAGISAAIYLDAGYADKPVNDGQYNIHVYQNKIINPRTLGISIASEMGNTGRDIHVYNNIIYDMNKGQGSGIKVADHTDDNSTQMGRLENIYIYNNTVYGRAQQGIYVNHPLIKNIVIRNNISVNNWIQIKIKEDVGIDVNEVIIENNLSWGYAQSGDFGINAIKEDPQFVDLENGNLQLKSTSPAIDKGTSNGAPKTDFKGTLRPQGNGYDIGAYEYIP